MDISLLFSMVSSDCRKTLKWSDSASKEPCRMFVRAAYLENVYAGGGKGPIVLHRQEEEYRWYVVII
jgi:hypothetical protein